jgi:Eukaryotic aspartyl protease
MSTDLVVPSIDCGRNCPGHNLYDLSQSRASHDLSKEFKGQSLDVRKMTGKQFQDFVALRKGSFPSVLQTFGAVAQYSSNFGNNYKYDGTRGNSCP